MRFISFPSLVSLALVILMGELSLAKTLSAIDTAQIAASCSGSEYEGVCSDLLDYRPEIWKCQFIVCAKPEKLTVNVPDSRGHGEYNYGEVNGALTDGVSCGDNKICENKVCRDIQPGEKPTVFERPQLTCYPDSDSAKALLPFDYKASI